jgi:hypothetical protein
MDFEKALAYELQTIPDLQGKVFPQTAEENIKPPFVVYVSSDGENIMTLSGPTEMTELTCEIHVVAETYEQLKSLVPTIINRTKTFFQRTIGRNGPLIKSVSHIEPVEEIDNNANYYRSSFDIRVRY